jgi:hypothetical protein
MGHPLVACGGDTSRIQWLAAVTYIEEFTDS